MFENEKLREIIFNVQNMKVSELFEDFKWIFVVLSIFILYYNIYLYFCVFAGIINTKLLFYFYSRFDNLDIDVKFKCKGKDSIKKDEDLFEKIDSYSESSENNMEKSVLFSNDVPDDLSHLIFKKQD